MTVNVICKWICFTSFELYRCYANSIIIVDCNAFGELCMYLY